MNLRASRRAFTLIELLVTIGIIALLAAILLPVIGHAIKSSECKRAQQDAASLATSIRAFCNEYARYPLQTSATADLSLGGPGGENHPLISAMVSNNSRRISLLEIPLSSRDANGNFIDPWDQPYGITLDFNMDNNLTGLSGGNSGTRLSGIPVAVWSAGPDQTPNTADDITSWH